VATPNIETVRQLPDGNWLLRVNGEERQTINLEQKRLMLTTQAERDSFALQIAALKDQVKAFEAIKAIDEKITANQAAMIARQDAWLESSGKLVFELQDALEAYRKAAKVGKIANALNHPAWKIGAAIAPFLIGVFVR
jgi:hypothetical protein